MGRRRIVRWECWGRVALTMILEGITTPGNVGGPEVVGARGIVEALETAAVLEDVAVLGIVMVREAAEALRNAETRGIAIALGNIIVLETLRRFVMLRSPVIVRDRRDSVILCKPWQTSLVQCR